MKEGKPPTVYATEAEHQVEEENPTAQVNQFMQDTNERFNQLTAMMAAIQAQMNSMGASLRTLTNQPEASNPEQRPEKSRVVTSGQDASSDEALVSKKQVEEMIQKATDSVNPQLRRVNSPYPSWMDEVEYPEKYKQPTLQTYDGKGSPRQHICHFKALTGAISHSEAPRIRLFISTLKDSAFDWYTMLPENSIHSWAELEAKFLSHFFDEDDMVSTLQLCTAKQEPKESVRYFIKRWRALAIRCPEKLNSNQPGGHVPGKSPARNTIEDGFG